MNTTVRMKASEIYKDWHVIDAAGRSLGRVATEAAVLLRGKHKPTYEPHLDDGDFVIIINASQVQVTGAKEKSMTYYRHSGYPGGLKLRKFPEMMERFPERVIERAVKGMLPGGTLGEACAKHLKVYKGANHPHQSQIAGSEKARALRDAERAAVVAETKKPARLRPLSVPDSERLAAELAAAPAPEPEAVAAAPAPKARRAKAEAPAAAEPVEAVAVAEAAVVAADDAEEAVAADAPAAEAKKPRRRAAKTEE